ncbi:hypothetical protein QQ045_029804 [Rhodiola kirilowii]
MELSNVALMPFNPPIPACPSSSYLFNYGKVMANCVLNTAQSSVGRFSFRRICSFPSESRIPNLSGLEKCKLFQQTYRLKPSSGCRVQSEDQEGTFSGESILVDQQDLERELQIAIEQENYALAAKIRDNLKNLHEDSRALVLAANARFYSSFRTGDLAGMQALWAKGDHVCCVHPGVPVISGYDLVIQSWEYVLADYEFPLKIELKDVLVHVRGDLGYVTCVEFIKTTGSSWGRQTATNVFERINGQWFICIHHATRIVT